MLRLSIFLLLSVLLTACGFHLKGTTDISVVPKTLSLSCDDTAVAARISQGLRAYGINIIPQTERDIHLTITAPESVQHETAIGDNDRSKEVELIDGFDVQVMQAQTLLGKQHISSSAYIHYDSNTYLGSSSEEKETLTRLRQDNIDKLIRYISTIIRQQP